MSFHEIFNFKVESDMIKKLKKMKKVKVKEIIEEQLKEIIEKQLNGLDDDLIVSFKNAIAENDKEEIKDVANMVCYNIGREGLNILREYLYWLLIQSRVIGDDKEVDNMWQLYYSV